MRRVSIVPLLIAMLLLLAGPSASAQSLPDRLRAKVSLKVVGEDRLIGQTQQLFQLHLISAGALLDEESHGWMLDVNVIASESMPELVALSMIVSQPMIKQEKPKGRRTTEEIVSGAWVLDYVASEMNDVRRIHQHEVVIVAEDEIEGAVSELVGQFSSLSIEPIREFWLEGQNRD